MKGGNRMKIAFYSLRKFDELGLCDVFSKKYGIDFVWTNECPNEDNLKLSEGCEAVCCTPCVFTEKYVDILSKNGVKYIICRSIGYDHLPLEYIKSKNMKIAAVNYPPDCVANYAIMLMLMTLRKMKQIMMRAQVQDYSLRGKSGKDITNCTAGIIGTGNIGAAVIKHLSGFGCKILACSRHEKEELKKYCEYTDIETLYSKSDVISLHVSSNSDTYHLINNSSISKMKDGVIIINTARGTLIDSNALIENLKTGKIGAAGLDVIENENGLYYFNRSAEILNNDELSMLNSFPNVIVTPHTAFYTDETVSNMVEKTFLSFYNFENNLPNPFEVR